MAAGPVVVREGEAENKQSRVAERATKKASPPPPPMARCDERVTFLFAGTLERGSRMAFLSRASTAYILHSR